jgi:Ca2+-binding EF-hand superfamily protein
VLDVFVEFDSDGSGSLDSEEFRAALNVLGVPPYLPPDQP